MAEKKEHLQKLFSLVNQVANEPGNEWFKNELAANFGGNLETVLNETEKSIKKIDEHFFKEITTKQAVNFYKDFKLTTIKDKLIFDFVRMEQFRREDNFEDFSLALYQQIENILNHLTEKNDVFRKTIIESKDFKTYTMKNKQYGGFNQYLLYHLLIPKAFDITESKYIENVNKIFATDIFKWDYTQKLRAVLYYFIFNKSIYNYFDFKLLIDVGNDIKQIRNLVHRGGFVYENQKENLNRIDSSKGRYYFKFLGFLETLVTKLNDKL